MEFRFRARDERLFTSNPIPSSDIPDILPDQALKAGSVGYADFKNLLPEGRSIEELRRELLEEQIKGEIIAQRIMQKRMLEKEAQRNFELNRKMSKIPTDDHQSSILVNDIDTNVAQRLSSSPIIEEIKEMPMEIDTPVEILVCEKRKNSTTSEETREVKHQKIVNEWGCALCHFSATNEDAFKEHIKDQNHITNLSKLSNGSRKATEHNNEKTLSEKAGKVQENKEVKTAKKTQEAKDKGLDGGELNCTICGVIVTGKSALIEHQKGKKHLAKAAKFNHSNSSNDFSSNDMDIDTHLKEKRHLAMALKLSIAPAINVIQKSSNEIIQPEKNAAFDEATTSTPLAQTCEIKLPKAENSDLSCTLCNIRVTCKLALEEHQRGKRHLLNVMKRSSTSQKEKGNGCNNSSSLEGKAINTSVIKEDMEVGEIHAAEYMV